MDNSLPKGLERIRDHHPRIYTIVSPPRCSSTAFSRVFWEQPSVRYYCHEPFEVTYYMGQGLQEVVEKLDAPIDLVELKHVRGDTDGRALVIKEMPYQVGERFPLLAGLATKPIIFLMRDPRLNISSRIRKKREVGDSPFFPLVETGWELIASQITHCRNEGIPHLIVDSSDFRNSPSEVFPQVLERFDLDYVPETLRWKECAEVELDNLEGKHRHLYGEVLESRGIKPDLELIPPLDWFPEERGMRDHVACCLEVYKGLRAAEERVRGSSGGHNT
ncbi:MAG: hypothetical protein GY769_13730 [bacterium]|nr:hypothetical protein [bacterium]